MFSQADIDSLEALYAQGQKVKAITEVRALALQLLPGHEASVAAWISKQRNSSLWQLPRDRSSIESILYRQAITFEHEGAATAVTYCAQWMCGKGASGATRDDLAADVFIALRRCAEDAPPPEPQRRLAALRALGGSVVRDGAGWKVDGIVELERQEKAAGRARCDRKTIRADLIEAAEAEQSEHRAGGPQVSPWGGLGR